MNHEGPKIICGINKEVFKFMNANVSASMPQFLPYFLEQFELIDLAFPTQFQLSQDTTLDQHIYYVNSPLNLLSNWKLCILSGLYKTC